MFISLYFNINKHAQPYMDPIDRFENWDLINDQIPDRK